MQNYHHTLDVYPIPKEKAPMYINEPWLIDETIEDTSMKSREVDAEKDNIRIYIPMDINKKAVLRRIDSIIMRYGVATEANEYDFQREIESVLAQVEIYDQIWYVRHMPKDSSHSLEAKEIIEAVIGRLEGIEDGCAELFPFELIDYLKKEYLGEE